MYKLEELRKRCALLRIRVTNTVDAMTLDLLASVPLKCPLAAGNPVYLCGSAKLHKRIE